MLDYKGQAVPFLIALESNSSISFPTRFHDGCFWIAAKRDEVCESYDVIFKLPKILQSKFCVGHVFRAFTFNEEFLFLSLRVFNFNKGFLVLSLRVFTFNKE